jgi:hypothetical protein
MSGDARQGTDRGLQAAIPDPRADEAGAWSDPALAAAGGPSPRPWIGGILAVLVVPLLLATSLTWGAGAGGAAAWAAAAREVSAIDLEARYGIRLNLVAVTAGGGLVDVRFTVVDGAKAGDLLRGGTAMPRLFVESRAAVLRAPHAHAHKLQILDGASYFLLYPNAGGVVQAGTGVSVVIEDIRTEPVTAQS